MGECEADVLVSTYMNFLLKRRSRANHYEYRSWVVYFIAIMYAGIVLATYGYNYFGLFLKAQKKADGSKRWTTEQVNVIPIAGGAINVVFGTFYGSARTRTVR